MVLMRNWQFFLLFTLGKIGQQNVFNDIIECVNASLDYKNNKLNIGILPKRSEKIGNFSIFFFTQNWTAESVSRVRVRLK